MRKTYTKSGLAFSFPASFSRISFRLGVGARSWHISNVISRLSNGIFWASWSILYSKLEVLKVHVHEVALTDGSSGEIIFAFI